MNRRTATAAAAVALVAALSSGVPARAAAPARVTGTVESGSVSLPKSAKAGRAQVQAMNIDTGAYGDAATVDRQGRYRLDLPAGNWALRSSVFALDRPFASFLSAAIVTRAGQRRTLPVTLKRFKKPRKRARPKRRRPQRPGARSANINPRDGRAYPGEAYAVERFSFAGDDSELGKLARNMDSLLITDLMTKLCPFTIVEWAKRSLILAELELQKSEHVDPASRVEPGHLIDPEIFIHGRVEDRPGTPRRMALIAWLDDFKTGARLSGEVTAVGLYEDGLGAEERLAQIVMRDLMCPRLSAAPTPPPAPPVAAPEAASPPPPPPPPSPPVPPVAPGTYVGTFSGEADSAGARTKWTWNGTLQLDAAQDSAFFVPNGAPPGSYRTFTVTNGSVDIAVESTTAAGGCTFRGSRHLDVVPGLMNTITVQLDTATPAYAVQIQGDINETVPTAQSGTTCPNSPPAFGVFGIWASTGDTAQTSSSMTLAGSHAELTPQTTADYDYTTRWSLTPGA
jgi:hypothetical protein